MYFCSKCDYSFDITKSSNYNTDNEDNKKTLKTPNDAIKRINKDLNKYKPLFSKTTLMKNKNYIKLTDDDKDKLELLFNNSELLNSAEFKCFNCGYVENINKTILLYKIDNKLSNSTIKTIEKNNILVNDPVLPRTKDYICKNVNCITHKDKSKKESVFYRDTDSYQLNYICNVCKFSWQI